MESKKKQNHKNSKKIEITKNTILAEIIHIPEAYQALVEIGVPCVSCPLVGFEMNFLTLEGIAKAYDINLDNLIKKIQQALDSN